MSGPFVLSANLEMMVPRATARPGEAIRLLADAGFPAVELWQWREWDLGAVRRALDATGTRLVTMCVEGWTDKTQLADPGSHDLFVARVVESASAAADVGCAGLVVLAGDVRARGDRTHQVQAVVDALARAAEAARAHGVVLLLEVVNREDEAPDAIVGSTRAAVDILRRVDDPSVRLLYDRYHAFRNGEATGEQLSDAVPLIGHIQIADAPGRHEPGTGVIDWLEEFRWLHEHGYAGGIGVEATPLASVADVYRGLHSLVLNAVADPTPRPSEGE